MANKFSFKDLEKKSKKAMQETIVIVANEAKNHYVNSFKNQGFTDESLEKWKPRKGEITGFSVSKKSKVFSRFLSFLSRRKYALDTDTLQLNTVDKKKS